jgi:sialic acid synthase SpsE
MSIFFDHIKRIRSPYIVAEIGSNHNGDMDLAKKMVLQAKECGSDCVKFQSFNKTSIISKGEYQKNQKYNDSAKKHFGSLEEMVEKYYLRKEQHYELKSYCDKIGIDFASTAFSKEEADVLFELDVPFIKVASMDINNLPFLNYLASKMKPMVLSTGMADLSEIDIAIKTIEYTGNNEIILLHCISIYPPKYEDINLNNIKMLKETFEYPVGFSDHSLGTSIPLASVALGSCIIEKHFTLDKNMPGWDHDISANPKELEEIVRESKNIATAMGSKKRVVSPDELEKQGKFRRSLVVSRDVKLGEILGEDDLLSKRPGKGIPPGEMKYVIGRTLKNDVGEDELLKWDDFI